MIQLTKQSSDSEIKAYFIQVLNLSRSKEEFPVNLDEVWPLVFKFRSDAVRALTRSNLFVKDIDYQVLSTNAQKSGVFSQNAQKSGVFAQNGEKSDDMQADGKSVMGRPQNTYMLSVLHRPQGSFGIRGLSPGIPQGSRWRHQSRQSGLSVSTDGLGGDSCAPSSLSYNDRRSF